MSEYDARRTLSTPAITAIVQERIFHKNEPVIAGRLEDIVPAVVFWKDKEEPIFFADNKPIIHEFIIGIRLYATDRFNELVLAVIHAMDSAGYLHYTVDEIHGLPQGIYGKEFYFSKEEHT